MHFPAASCKKRIIFYSYTKKLYVNQEKATIRITYSSSFFRHRNHFFFLLQIFFLIIIYSFSSSNLCFFVFFNEKKFLILKWKCLLKKCQEVFTKATLFQVLNILWYTTDPAVFFYFWLQSIIKVLYYDNSLSVENLKIRTHIERYLWRDFVCFTRLHLIKQTLVCCSSTNQCNILDHMGNWKSYLFY